MFYDFECCKCKRVTEHQFGMADVPRTVTCECGYIAKRLYSPVAIGIDGGIDRTSGFGESMRKRNEKAAKKMREKAPPMRTVAHDYGNGDIREVKK